MKNFNNKKSTVGKILSKNLKKGVSKSERILTKSNHKNDYFSDLQAIRQQFRNCLEFKDYESYN
jgi:hypothetical protein